MLISGTGGALLFGGWLYMLQRSVRSVHFLNVGRFLMALMAKMKWGRALVAIGVLLMLIAAFIPADATWEDGTAAPPVGGIGLGLFIIGIIVSFLQRRTA